VVDYTCTFICLNRFCIVTFVHFSTILTVSIVPYSLRFADLFVNYIQGNAMVFFLLIDYIKENIKLKAV